MRTSAGLCNFSCPRGRRVPSKLVRSLIKGRLGAFSPDIYLFSNVYKPPPILCVLGIFGNVFSRSFEANGKAGTFSPMYNYILHSIFHFPSHRGKIFKFYWCVCRHVLLWWTCGGQRATCSTQFPPSVQ